MCENLILFDDFDGPNEETKVFLNGIILGMTSNPHELIEELRKFRNVKMLPWDVSFSYNDTDEEIHICSDDGRLYRPVFTVKDDHLIATMEDGTNWDELVAKGMITYIDSMEANEAVIAFNENELVKYKNDYCEIAPAMMLGVMASIIPFPDHSQCIFQDEPVYMANGTVKKICQVQVGEEVITFHPDTQQQSITKVSHIYTNKTDKQLFEITTISGRKITATFDHRFMTFDGWKRIEEIQVGKTLVGVSTEPKPVSNLVDDYVILTKDQFIERCLDAKIKESFVKKYTSELSFPIKSTDTNLYILSRLFGFISTDCWIGISDQGVVRVAGDFGHEHSAILFNEDVEKLGFNTKIPRYSEKEGYGCTYRLEYSGSFPALFIALGCLYGKKSIQEYKPLPDWIKNGSDLVKREFLAGFQGGDGSKIKSGSTKQVHIHMSPTSKSIKTEYVDSLMEFMNDIVELLQYFKIETNNAKCETSQKYEDRMTVSYYISSTRINLIKYFDLVGYRYDVYKNIESGIYVEYLKYLEKKYTERLKLVEEIKSYTDMIPSLIAEKMNIDVKIVRKIKKLQSVKIGLPKGLLSAEEWRNLVKWKSTTLFIPLESKIESLETIISDITTESTNQSFLCGDTFCVHNSPRNCYQCLDPETLVLMSDNTKKAIKDIKIGDSVISVDPISCIQSTTKVINQYVRETNKEIICIETESGRKITCTNDHPVLTTDGWKQAIDAENICVIPQQVVYSGGDEDLDISEMMKDDEYISELTSLGLYPVVRSKALPILARIVGKLIADEIFTKRQVKFFFNAPEDYEDFIKDLQELGFSYDSISFVHFAERVRICLFLNNAFDSLLKALTYNKDDWIIKNGSMLVKREYLSGGGSDFMEDNKVTGHQCLFEEFHIENQSEYFEKIGYRYDISKYVKNLRIYEYTKICQRSGQQFFWEREVRDRAIFVKIISKTKVKGNMIADITTESDNHSFIAGDSFCVHNSSMGKQAMSMFALSHLIRADTIVHVLNSPQKPLVSTKAATMMGFDNMPAGINCIVAIACYTGLTLVRPLPRRKTFGKFTSQ